MTEELKKRIAQINAGTAPAGYKKTKVGIVPEEWEICHFKKQFARLRRKNTEGNTNVLTISAQYGLINQEEFFKKEVASEDKSNYYLLYSGDFAYNKSYSNGYPFGAFKMLDRYDSGVVSPLYICFTPTESNVCPAFYVQYFENGMMNREIQAVAQEGARNHGLLNISIDDFFNSYLLCPPLTEQQKIAEILTAQDAVIALMQKQIELKQQRKKGLMQKLLSGEVRVGSGEWQKRKIKEFCRTSSGTTPSRKEQSNFQGDILWLSSGELKSKYVFDSAEKISEQAAVGMRVYEAGTVVIAIYGLEAAGIRGTCSIIQSKCTISQACMAFTDFDGIINEFFYYWYLWQGQIIGTKYAQGTKQQNLSSDIVDNILVNLPSLPEQEKIAEILSAQDNEIELLQQQLALEQQKKKALMQLLLTGKVRVKT